MSLNTSHVNNGGGNGGVLLHAGECILLFVDNVSMEFHGQQQEEFQGTKKGKLYLTTHRMIFNAKDVKERMQSFSFPFITLSDVEIEQPMLGANYIKGKCRAQPNGNWIGECKFKLYFKSGGAIEYGTAMLRAASMAQQHGPAYDIPPPYQPPGSEYYAAPPPAYDAPPMGQYGWTLPTNTFSDRPPANSVYMTDSPPPYPGIYPGLNQQYQGYASGNAQHPGQNGGMAWANPGYNGQAQAGAYPNYPPPYYAATQQGPYNPSRPY